VGLLVVLVVLGVTAGIVVAALPSSVPTLPSTSTTTHRGGGTTTTTAPRTIVSAAILAECVANVQAVQMAAETYVTVNGTTPPAGTSWATSAAKGGPYLHGWPVAPGQYVLAWNGTAVVVIAAHGRSSTGSPGIASPPTGCYAA
jgi:hypothetical protein